MSIASISFHRFTGARARLWALTQMGMARPFMARVPDIEFWKLCGSGTGEGFTPKPNFGVYAILAIWPDLATAQHRIAQTPIFERYRAHAAERWTVYLSAISARGAWAGSAPFDARAQGADEAGPLAVLTRATIKPKAIMRFWGKEPPISAAIGANRDVMFKIGIGESPLFQQVTFSIWPDQPSMHAFAHEDGPHQDAIRAVRSGGWFREELYARFRILTSEGTWHGADPLITAEKIAA